MFAIADLIRRQTDNWAREQHESAASLPGAVLRHMESAAKLRRHKSGRLNPIYG